MIDESMPPPLGEQTRAFLDAHLVEPDDRAIERVRGRLVAQRKRPRFPPELMAVAAVVLAVVSAQAVWLVVHRHSPVTAKGVVEAYRSGDIALAEQLALECQGDGCDQITVVGLARLETLTRRLDSLTGAEQRELRKLEGVWLPPELSSHAWVVRVRALRNVGRVDEALELAQWCTQHEPVALECIRALGELRAQVGTRDGDQAMLAGARSAYQWYLRVAPANDAYRARVTAGLGPAEPSSFDARLSLPVHDHGIVRFGEPFSTVTSENEGVATGTIVGGETVDVLGVSVGTTSLEIVTESGAVRRVEISVLP